ncbi:MAG TPA: DUF2911 domain-containing protein [Longimicrobiales bacterium]
MRAFALVGLLMLAGCSTSAPVVSHQMAVRQPERSLLVTRLGDDTVAVERVVRTADSLVATVLLRSPQTTLRTYRVALDDAGRPVTMRVEQLDPATGAPTQSSDVSLARESSIPFLDMVHWPFELMLERAAAAAPDTIILPLLAGERTVAFRMAPLGGGRFAATHPTRGTMTIETDYAGRLLTLDASNTTRALRVTREPDADVAPLARLFAERPMGELSGRGEVSTNVGGAQIEVDYGVPLKRGRDIFGALVPFDRVWRTGANRATHLSTSRPLRFADEVLPAGSYTLFTIPRAERWTLIVNRNVDINGQAYDASADLLHVDMAVRALDQVVEPFTIVVEPNGPSAGVLRLRWDRTEAWVPFVLE